nr:hypothetical protein [Tanacetum cinerariifolium]
MGFPSTLDEGTHKSQPFPEGTTIDRKVSGGNVQLADNGLPSMDFNKCTAKKMPCPEGPLRDKDLEGNKTPADMELINPTVADPLGTGADDWNSVVEFLKGLVPQSSGLGFSTWYSAPVPKGSATVGLISSISA